MDPLLTVKSFLENNRMASLATVSGVKRDPHIAVIYYLYENGAIYFATEKSSRKAKDIFRNKKVAIAIAQEKELEVLQIEGKGELVIDKEERVVIVQKIHNRLSKGDVHEPWPLMKLHPQNIEVFEVSIELFTYSNFIKEISLKGDANDLLAGYRQPQERSKESGSSHRPRFLPHLKRR